MAPDADVDPIHAVILVTPDVPMREQPTGDAKAVTTLRRGARIRILDAAPPERGAWVRVDPSTGRTGWIAGDAVVETSGEAPVRDPSSMAIGGSPGGRASGDPRRVGIASLLWAVRSLFGRSKRLASQTTALSLAPRILPGGR